MKLPLHLKFFIFVRSFFIQNGWNFKSMISLGFCFALQPLAKRLYKNDVEKYNAFIRRQLNFFNAHPYFGAFALGAVARLEMEHKKNGKPELEQVEKLKTALVGPLGALGDDLFWSAVLPASMAFGVAGLLLIGSLEWRLIFLGLLFILYNMPHFLVRWQGIGAGFEQGFAVGRVLKTENFKYLKHYRWLGVVSLAVLSGIVVINSFSVHFFGPVVFAGSAFLAAWLKRRLSKSYLAMMIPLILAILFGLFRGI